VFDGVVPVVDGAANPLPPGVIVSGNKTRQVTVYNNPVQNSRRTARNGKNIRLANFLRGAMLDLLVLIFKERGETCAASTAITLGGYAGPRVVWVVRRELLKPNLGDVPQGEGNISRTQTGVIWVLTSRSINQERRVLFRYRICGTQQFGFQLISFILPRFTPVYWF
jgi:hypothetical protein